MINVIVIANRFSLFINGTFTNLAEKLTASINIQLIVDIIIATALDVFNQDKFLKLVYKLLLLYLINLQDTVGYHD